MVFLLFPIILSWLGPGIGLEPAPNPYGPGAAVSRPVGSHRLPTVPFPNSNRRH